MSDASMTVANNTRLTQLKKIRLRLILGLSGLTLGSYFGFILLVAFDPRWLTLPLSTHSRLTTGIVAGVGLYWFCVLVTGFYTWYANRRIDPLLEQLQRAHDQQERHPDVDQGLVSGIPARRSA